MKYTWLLLGVFFFSSALFADTLYQADVGGYSTSVGVGLGSSFGVGGAYGATYNAAPNYSAYGGYAYPGTGMTGVPYDNFTYPYSGGCCGCNRCNNCDTGYGARGRY